MDINERLLLGREALEDNVTPSKYEAIFLYDLIRNLQEENKRLEKFIENLQDIHEVEKARLKYEFENMMRR